MRCDATQQQSVGLPATFMWWFVDTHSVGMQEVVAGQERKNTDQIAGSIGEAAGRLQLAGPNKSSSSTTLVFRQGMGF